MLGEQRRHNLDHQVHHVDDNPRGIDHRVNDSHHVDDPHHFVDLDLVATEHCCDHDHYDGARHHDDPSR
jgi:hypothetical protein